MAGQRRLRATEVAGQAPQLILLRLGEGAGGEDPLARRRAASAAARRLAEEHVGRITGRAAIVRRGENGRPLVRWARGVGGPPPPSISIAHDRRWIGVAISPAGRLGVDLEPAGRVPEHVAMRVMSPRDRASFLALDPALRRRMAAWHWVSAEALAKADGGGLQLMLSRSIRPRLQRRGRWGPYRFAVGEPVDGLVCALALDRSADIAATLRNPLVLDRSPRGR